MTKEQKREFLEGLLLKQQQDNLRLKLNIKYYKDVVIPHLKVQHKKRETGKMEVDNAVKQVPEWEKSIDMNKKFMKIVKKEISHFKGK